MRCPGWFRALKDRDVRVRRQACYVLGELGRRSNEVVQVLIDTLDDEDPEVR